MNEQKINGSLISLKFIEFINICHVVIESDSPICLYTRKRYHFKKKRCNLNEPNTYMWTKIKWKYRATFFEKKLSFLWSMNTRCSTRSMKADLVFWIEQLMAKRQKILNILDSRTDTELFCKRLSHRSNSLNPNHSTKQFEAFDVLNWAV